MPSKVEAFGLLLVLMPGFLCAYVVQALAVRRKQSETEKIVEALIFSLILYLSTLRWFSYGLPLSWQETPTGSNVFHITLRWGQLCVLTLLSLVTGILYAAAINHDWIMRVFRFLKITERTSRSTIWNDVFGQIAGWVQVGLTDGVIVKGWLAYYSDDPEESSLYIEQAAWIKEDGTEEFIDGPGVLITKEMGIEYVVFLHARNEVLNEVESRLDAKDDSA